jgi:hypothetical protein
MQSSLTSYDFDSTTSGLIMPDLPPSLLAAAENYQIMTPYAGIVDEDPWETVEGDEAYDRAAAMTPSSYSHRMLQMSLPQMQCDMERWSDQTSCEVASSQRVDSAIGSVDELPDFVGTVDLPGFQFEEASHQGSFPEARVSTGTGGDELEENCYYQPASLQYHLIQMRSRAELKEDPAPTTSSHHSGEVALSSTQKYEAA